MVSEYGSDDPVPGWWRASDGRWYPPESHPDERAAAVAQPAVVVAEQFPERRPRPRLLIAAAAAGVLLGIAGVAVSVVEIGRANTAHRAAMRAREEAATANAGAAEADAAREAAETDSDAAEALQRVAEDKADRATSAQREAESRAKTAEGKLRLGLACGRVQGWAQAALLVSADLVYGDIGFRDDVSTCDRLYGATPRVGDERSYIPS
jgi:hypothetical protein